MASPVTRDSKNESGENGSLTKNRIIKIKKNIKDVLIKHHLALESVQPECINLLI